MAFHWCILWGLCLSLTSPLLVESASLGSIPAQIQKIYESAAIYVNLKQHKPSRFERVHPLFPPANVLINDAYLLLKEIDKLKQLPFFRIFRVDIWSECPFWVRDQICHAPDSPCGMICECKEAFVPEVLKADGALNLVDTDLYQKDTTTEFNDVDVHSASDILYNSTTEKGLSVFEKVKSRDRVAYADMTLNRPGFTGYNGTKIWLLIYNENCLTDPSRTSKFAPIETDQSLAVECTEEKAFYNIISGAQMLITVLNSRYYRLKFREAYLEARERHKKSGAVFTLQQHEWYHQPNDTYFLNNVAPYKDRLHNFYFSFGVMLTTLCRLRKVIEGCHQCKTGNEADDRLIAEYLHEFAQAPFATCDSMAEAGPFFTQKHAMAVRQFHNISQILNCVDCEICRLHGKIKFWAAALSLRTLGPSPNVTFVERNEFVALLSAVESFADGVRIIEEIEQRSFQIVLAIGFTSLIIVISIMFLLSARRPKEKTL